MPTIFRYSSLRNEGNIRLLRVLPGQPNDTIECELVETSIDSNPQELRYTAISYCWGDPTYSQPILINRQEHLTTKSAKEVIQHVRDLADSRLVWIDAVGINQADVTERNAQVRLMGKLYSKSEQTLVWLGSAYDESDLAMDFMVQLLKAIESFPDPTAIEAALLLKALNVEEGAPEWKALAQLFDRPWLRRVWVIQEVALSDTVRVACGSKVLPWDHFERVMPAVASGHLNFLWMNFLKGFQIPGTSNFLIMQDVRRRLQKRVTSMKLWQLLGVTYYTLASEDRDYVIGLMGLLRSNYMSEMDVGYDNSISEVYQRATQLALIEDGHLWTLCLAGTDGHQALTSLPSWVPDFSNRAKRKLRPFGFPELQYQCATQTSDNDLNLEGALADLPRQNIRFTGRTMSAIGALADSVSSLGHVFLNPHLDGTEGTHKTWCDWLYEAVNMANISGDDPAHLAKVDSLWRTLCGDRDYFRGEERAPQAFRECFAAFREIFMHPRFLGVKIPKEAHDEIAEDDSLPLPRVQAAYRYYRSCLEMAVDRRFYITENGRFGLAPATAKVGDEVCVILGANLPYLVRKAPTFRSDSPKYRIVGSCYIDGLMYGKARGTASFKELYFE